MGKNQSRALVFANGDLNRGSAVASALDQASAALIIAADGGARMALACDRVPDVIVGDLDSLTPDEVAEFRARGIEIEQHPAGKDETDLELALLAAVDRGATWIRIIGGVGDRVDQTLANFYLLTLPELADCDVRLVAGKQTLWLIGPGDYALDNANFPAFPGDTISLIPLAGDAENVCTVNLDYPLRGETLRFGPARGVSNVIAAAGARVSLDSGLLMVVHTPGRA